MNRTSSLLISSYSFYLYDLSIYQSHSFASGYFLHHSLPITVRSKSKGSNRLNIDTILRADLLSTLKFLIKGREEGEGNCNFGTFIAHLNLWILSPLSNLWFSMERPSPTLLPNLPFYGSNNRKLAWNTISNLFRASVPICNPYEIQKTKRMVFWSFQVVKNWNIASKWIKWMDQGIAHFSLLWLPLDLWFQIKIPTRPAW